MRRLIQASATPLVAALEKLVGLRYCHAGVDPETNTVVNVSVWSSLDATEQTDSLAEMLAQRPILEGAGVQLDRIANSEPLWTIGEKTLA